MDVDAGGVGMEDPRMVGAGRIVAGVEVAGTPTGLEDDRMTVGSTEVGREDMEVGRTVGFGGEQLTVTVTITVRIPSWPITG